MIELVIAALIQVATITSDGSVNSAASADNTETTTTTVTRTGTSEGGTGTWDDNQ